uniref:Uncharacterized protein n=1 Tax=Romanomermis culicivorax TaxID=13658 RepID=A0A915HZ10_ROMCU
MAQPYLDREYIYFSKIQGPSSRHLINISQQREGRCTFLSIE